MDRFFLNGYLWKIVFVEPNDSMLVDRMGTLTVATTDPSTYTIYLSNRLHGDFLLTVFIHELGHCAIISFDLADDIHRAVKPEYWVEAEEWVCNFIADYGAKIFTIAFKQFGYDAWKYIPEQIERFIA